MGLSVTDFTAVELSGFFRFLLSFSRRGFFFLFHAAFNVITSVEGIQQNLLQLGDQRVARVSAGALVVKCVFRQLVNVGQEVGFLHASFADRLRNTQLSFDFVQPAKQFFDFRCGAVTRCSQTQMVRDFSVATTCLRAVVLAECCLFSRVVVRVIANNVADQQGVRQTVRNVELRAQLVRH